MSSIKELLKRSAADTFGFFPAYPGLLLKLGRYKVIRLLGFGQFSSAVLVEDLEYVPGTILPYTFLLAT
jgi:hypothetical protein